MSLSELKVRKLVRQYEALERDEGVDHERDNEIRERCRSLKDSEGAFLWKAVSRGRNARVLRAGWPDFLILEDGKGYAVEVKRWPDRVSARQAEMFEALESLGIKVFVWTASKPNELRDWRRWNRKVSS